MKLTCREICGLLLDFVDDTMPADQRAIFEKHMCACPPCRVYLDTYQHTIKLTRTLPCEPLPSEMVDRLRAVFEAAKREMDEQAQG